MGTTINLKKAILQTTSDGQYLLPYDLEPVLHEELLRLQPLLELLPFGQAGSKTHEYNLRTSHPQGWFEGEITAGDAAIGGYTRKSVVVKIGRIWGSVAGFAQAMDERFVDALATEIENSLFGMADLFEYSALYGCANDITFTGDAYQTTGILPRVFKDAPENVLDGGGDKITLDDLDEMLSKVRKYRQTMRDPAIWFAGIRMKQVLDGLQSKVQLPLQSVELADGKLIMAAYADAPIFQTEYMVPGTTSPADLDGVVAAGGTLPDGDYKHRIASITMFGECVAGALTTADTAGAGNNKVNLTWTADANAKLYMIFRTATGAAGDAMLIDIIAAKTYDGNGKVSGNVEAYSDDGSKSTISQVIPLETGEQQILYANRHPVRGAGFIGRIDDMGRQIGNMLQYVEMARTKDTYDYFLKAYFAMLMRYPNLFGVIRNVKTA